MKGILVILLLLVAGCSEVQEAPEEKVVIAITDFGFSPSQLNVPSGTEVIWVNRDVLAHNLVFEGFESGELLTDGYFSKTFEEPGSYDYYCSYHPELRGKIIIK